MLHPSIQNKISDSYKHIYNIYIILGCIVCIAYTYLCIYLNKEICRNFPISSITRFMTIICNNKEPVPTIFKSNTFVGRKIELHDVAPDLIQLNTFGSSVSYNIFNVSRYFSDFFLHSGSRFANDVLEHLAPIDETTTTAASVEIVIGWPLEVVTLFSIFHPHFHYPDTQ